MSLIQNIGDSATYRIPMQWKGLPFTPAADWSLTLTIKAADTDADAAALLQKASNGYGITVSGSTAVLEILRADTYREADYPETGDLAFEATPGTYIYDIQATGLPGTAHEGKTRTVAGPAAYILTRDITRSSNTSVPIFTTEDPAPLFVVPAGTITAITAAATIAPITGDEIAPALSGGVLGKFTYTAIKAWMLDGISSAWADITGKPAFGGASLLEVGTTAGTVAAGDHNHSGVYQPADANIVSVSTPADNDFIQRVSGSWVTRTIAQVKTALGLGSAAYTASTDYATALGADDNYVTDAQKAALHAAATVTGNGIAITGQALSLSIGTGSTQVAAGNHSHALLDSATDAATAGTLVKRGSVGQASFASDSSATALSAANSGSGIAATIESTSGIGADIYSISGTAAYITSGSGIGANIYSTSGPYAAYISNLGSGMGADIRSYSGTGAGITSESGTYHATFGLGGNDRSFVARLLGALGWWRGAYTLMVSAVDTLTADRVQRFPDKDGTIALTSDISGTNSGTNTGDQNLSGLAVKSANLSDLASASTARTNLGLGTLATQSGTFSGTSSGTNTGNETAATIATALNAGTQDSTASDTDRIAVVHPAGGWMSLPTLWTWIAAILDAGRTWAGVHAFSGSVSVTGNTTVAGTSETAVALGTVTTTATLVITAGTLITATLTASTACTFTMPTATAGKSFTLLLKQAATTGNGTATFTSVKWSGGTAPTITATAAKMDILTFVSDGTNWYGSFAQNFTP